MSRRPKRCHQEQMGPFGTLWRCLLDRHHEGEHQYLPDQRFEYDPMDDAVATSVTDMWWPDG